MSAAHTRCHTGSDREHLIGRVCSTCGHPATCYTLKGIGTELCDVHSICPCDGCGVDRAWAISERIGNAHSCEPVDVDYWLRGIPEVLTAEVRAYRASLTKASVAP